MSLSLLYKRKKLAFTIIKPTWRVYQATEVVPSCVTRGTCIPNMLPGRPISGGSVLNGQACLIICYVNLSSTHMCLPRS